MNTRWKLFLRRRTGVLGAVAAVALVALLLGPAPSASAVTEPPLDTPASATATISANFDAPVLSTPTTPDEPPLRDYAL
jgi:hypothetical protein